MDIIFYNERLEEVEYPERYELSNVLSERCEVIVQGKVLNLKEIKGCDITSKDCRRGV